MIYKIISLTTTALFFSLLTSAYLAQSCGPLSLDSINNPGEYTYSSLTEPDGIRNGPDYNGATLYYPTNATGPFVGMVIVPGYVSAQSTIQNWGPFLASHGIVTMTIGTNSIWEYPEARRDALLDALTTLKEENTRAGSPLFGQIDTNSLAVGGWSMGGGGAQLAAAADPSIKAVMALCPWLDTGLTPADIAHSAPIVIFSAENDGVAPPASHADIHYDYALSTTSKMLFEIAGGSHQAANDPIGANEDVGKIAVSWLQNFLIGDTCYCPLVLNAPSTASKYQTNVECAGIVLVNEPINAETVAYQLYPNPANDKINLEVKNWTTETNYHIISITGAQIAEGKVIDQTSIISLNKLAPGIYIFELSSEGTSTKSRFIVQ
ncbi:MAG: dienelactone hydrolase [Parvicella sp.]|jgi:dienelactone hydrolase